MKGILMKPWKAQAIHEGSPEIEWQTRRIISKSNSFFGIDGADWNKLCWDGSEVIIPENRHLWDNGERGSIASEIARNGYHAPLPYVDNSMSPEYGCDYTWHYLHVSYDWAESGTIYRVYPRFKIGERAYIKETHYRYGRWIIIGWNGVRSVLSFYPFSHEICFTDNPPERIITDRRVGEVGWYKRSPLFLPADLARTIIEITDIRAQRVQDISEDDAIAEGVGAGWQMNAGWPDYQHIKNGVCALTQDTARLSFWTLWNSIHGDGAWDLNPWVWAYTFRRIER